LARRQGSAWFGFKLTNQDVSRTALSSVTRYGISKPQIIREQFDEEVVIVDLDSGNYYSLSGAGGEVWSGLEKGASQAEIVARLHALYEAEETVIAAAIDSLLTELQSEDLISARSEEGGLPYPAGDTPAARTAWEVPVLQKFTDMQALLLLDPIHEVDSAGWPQPLPEDQIKAHQAANGQAP
jgi:hypothetical protein